MLTWLQSNLRAALKASKPRVSAGGPHFSSRHAFQSETETGWKEAACRTLDVECVVGAEGFEPPTLWSQTRCATRLRYAPTPGNYRTGPSAQLVNHQARLGRGARAIS